MDCGGALISLGRGDSWIAMERQRNHGGAVIQSWRGGGCCWILSGRWGSVAGRKVVPEQKSRPRGSIDSRMVWFRLLRSVVVILCLVSCSVFRQPFSCLLSLDFVVFFPPTPLPALTPRRGRHPLHSERVIYRVDNGDLCPHILHPLQSRQIHSQSSQIDSQRERADPFPERPDPFPERAGRSFPRAARSTPIAARSTLRKGGRSTRRVGRSIPIAARSTPKESGQIHSQIRQTHSQSR